MWGAWSDWSECDSECGPGMQNRSRVVALERSENGRVCEGSSLENRSCNSTVECTGENCPTCVHTLMVVRETWVVQKSFGKCSVLSPE